VEITTSFAANPLIIATVPSQPILRGLKTGAIILATLNKYFSECRWT
jgi:hypothetical protein